MNPEYIHAHNLLHALLTMSQQSVLSYFKSVKRSNPDQHAAKRRKVILQSHQIESLLDTESEDSDAESEVSNGSRIEEDAVEEESPSGVRADCDDFVDDPDWEDEANKTLDDVEKSEKDMSQDAESKSSPQSPFHGFAQQDTPRRQCLADVIASVESVVSVTTWAGDDHTAAPPLHTPTASSAPPSNTRHSKTVPRLAGGAATPGSSPAPLFTLGATARKRLSWSVARPGARVVFTKVGGLARRGGARRHRHYAALDKQLTPQLVLAQPDTEQTQTAPPPPPAGVSRNLFSASPGKPQVPDLAPAISSAKQLTERKISPAEVRAKLGRAKLRDLRSLLAGIEGSKLRAAEARAAVPRSPAKQEPALELEIVATPTQSPLKRVHTPVKARASPRKVPAYQRYHTLAQPVSRSLALPLTYSRLLEVFRSTDTVVSMFHNRQERITVPKLARSTTDLMNKKWTTDHLRKILCVFPQAYKVSWRRSKVKLDTRELVVEPNMHYKRDLMDMFDPSKPGLERGMTADTLVERRDMFRNGLLEIVKDYHEEFLASLDPPITADRRRITTWHKEFSLDILPDIDLADLPPHPDTQPAGQQTRAAADYVNINPKLSDVLTNINTVNKNKDGEEQDPSPSQLFFSPTKSVQSPRKALDGINPSLIAKIKAKEAAKAKLEMTRSQEQIEKIELLKKLPKLARKIK